MRERLFVWTGVLVCVGLAAAVGLAVGGPHRAWWFLAALAVLQAVLALLVRRQMRELVRQMRRLSAQGDEESVPDGSGLSVDADDPEALPRKPEA
jgi:membrane protein implicated in regulation of membrane protease activity